MKEIRKTRNGAWNESEIALLWGLKEIDEREREVQRVGK